VHARRGLGSRVLARDGLVMRSRVSRMRRIEASSRVCDVSCEQISFCLGTPIERRSRTDYPRSARGSSGLRSDRRPGEREACVSWFEIRAVANGRGARSSGTHWVDCEGSISRCELRGPRNEGSLSRRELRGPRNEGSLSRRELRGPRNEGSLSRRELRGPRNERKTSGCEGRIDDYECGPPPSTARLLSGHRRTPGCVRRPFRGKGGGPLIRSRPRAASQAFR